MVVEEEQYNILGTKISTAEIDDNAITTAKLSHHTGEGIQVFDAGGVPVILDSGSGDQAVKMNTGGTALEFGTLAGGNMAIGITPTQSGWSTPFTDLTNATDDDLTTFTSEAEQTGAGGSFHIQIDLGSEAYYTYVCAKFDYTTNSGDTCKVEVKGTAGSWIALSDFTLTNTTASKNLAQIIPVLMKVQYVRVVSASGNADLRKLKVYEIAII